MQKNEMFTFLFSFILSPCQNNSNLNFAWLMEARVSFMKPWDDHNQMFSPFLLGFLPIPIYHMLFFFSVTVEKSSVGASWKVKESNTSPQHWNSQNLRSTPLATPMTYWERRRSLEVNLANSDPFYLCTQWAYSEAQKETAAKRKSPTDKGPGWEWELCEF